MVSLRRSQPELVQYFSSYRLIINDELPEMRRSMTHIDDQDTDDVAGAENEDEPMDLDEPPREFCPETSLIDRMLFYHITGRELDECMSKWRRDPLPSYAD